MRNKKWRFNNDSNVDWINGIVEWCTHGDAKVDSRVFGGFKPRG